MSNKRRAADLLRFMQQVADAYPEGEVHIVWDNLNIHHDGPGKRWTKFNPAARWPVPLPLHATAGLLGQPGRAPSGDTSDD